MKMMNSKIPCLDLKRQHQAIKREIFEQLESVYDNTQFSQGTSVAAFETNFAEFLGTKYVVAVNSGTSALHLAILALGIGDADEIIIPANTFIATPWSAAYVGAKPVFVDCDPNTWEVDPAHIEKNITKRTKAVIGVHLYGQPFDVEAVKKVCDKHGISLVEDAAQAQGARYKNTKVGNFGELACFSFYPGKNLGACGEGGAIATNSELYHKHLLSLRNHGSVKRYYHTEVGYNYRMGGFEGASLSVKLKYLESWNRRRQEIAKRYKNEILNPRIKMQNQPDWGESIFHLFVITTENRDSFVKHLEDNNIIPAFHYPVPCHLQEAFKNLGYKRGDHPNSEYLADHCISLPMFPELTDEEVGHVIDVVNNYL